MTVSAVRSASRSVLVVLSGNRELRLDAAGTQEAIERLIARGTLQASHRSDQRLGSLGRGL